MFNTTNIPQMAKHNIQDSDRKNINGFAQRPQDAGKPKGKLSIKNDLIQRLESTESVIRVEKSKCKSYKDHVGQEFWEYEAPTKDAMIDKFMNVAINGKPADSISAFKFVVELIDGKAKQQVEQIKEANQNIDFSKISDAALDEFVNAINLLEV